MPNVSAHKRKAHHNEMFFQLVQAGDSLSNPRFPDWMVTVAFYIALHHVDLKLAELAPPLHPRNHPERNSYVAIYLPLDVGRDYIFLKNKSEYARYIPDSERRISAQMVQRCINLALTKFK